MQTRLYQITPDDTIVLQEIGAILRSGGLVGIPTETVYGLAASALDGPAVAKIFWAKGRPQDNPLIVHISEFSQIYTLVREVPSQAVALARAYWPGPLTIILPNPPRFQTRSVQGSTRSPCACPPTRSRVRSSVRRALC